MHLKGSYASWLPKGIEEVTDYLLDEAGDGAAGGGERLYLFALEQGPGGYVECHETQGPACLEYYMRGMWVRIDIGL